ncbi:MAG TPA: hypothetical protein DD417_00650 [Elusimicrobia bacterium]|nr:hypothetical protein [Elusimicrobiota bacterium]
MLRRGINIFGTVLLITLPLHCFMARTGTCTQSDTGHFLAAMWYAGVTAVPAGLCLILKPRYNVLQWAFLGLAGLAAPILLTALLSTTISGHSLCGGEFDDYGVERWERLYAPYFLCLLGAFAGVVWSSRKQRLAEVKGE